MALPAREAKAAREAEAARIREARRQRLKGRGGRERESSLIVISRPKTHPTRPGYLLWSQKEKDVAAKRFNLSKALRRLEACADFGWKHKARLEVPTKLEDLERAYGQWGQVVGQHPDPDGRTVWFIDLTMIDTPAMKKEANWDLHLRLFWWVVTWLAMDPNTQKNGITFWQDMGHAGMMDLLTLVPRDLNNDIDELSSGVAAIKMKHFYISRNPWWGRLLLNMMCE